MKSFISLFTFLVLAVGALMGPCAQAQQVEVRTLHPSNPGPWVTNITQVSDFEMQVVNAHAGDWIVPVVTASIVAGSETSGATLDLYRKIYPALDPEALTGQAMLTSLGDSILTDVTEPSLVLPPDNWTTFCDLGLMHAAFDRATASVDAIRTEGQVLFPSQTQLSWQSLGYSTWPTNCSAAVYWAATHSGTTNMTMDASLLARAVMLDQFALHDATTGTVAYVESAIKALSKVDLNIRLDITLMIITDGAHSTGTGGNTGPNGTPRSLPSLPSGPRPRVILPNPVTVTFLPTPPVNNDGVRVVEFPAPLPTIYPYLLGDSIEVALAAPSSQPVLALFQILPESIWYTSPVTYLSSTRVELTLPTQFPGGAVYFFTDTGSPVIPVTYTYGLGIFAVPFVTVPD